MPGYLGGGSGGGAGGEIDFPKELIDPVTKLRVSQPENLIDTDFEYGLQPTKWETLELINNTPSFFSKSGDTTIDGIISITTNAGTREITVRTALDHGLAVGIPLNVTGSKSITADGAYIINSIPDSQTFTYLCKDNQPETLSIEDLYTSIITGEFFQGSQIRISDAGGMVTDNATPESTITVTLDSTHGFGVNTPFYFLNLNSSLSQQFDASNSSSKSFDASNTATAQTFDGSNTLSSTNIDYSNSATLSGTVSNITNVNPITDEITVQHTTENFSGRPLGTPLYYSVTASSGFFATNPRGVVFLKNTVGLGTSSSVFQVSATPDGAVIDIAATFTGTFQLANQARTFAGNNRNPLTEIPLTIVKEANFVFDGNNQGFAGEIATNGLATVEGYSGNILVSTPANAGLDYYPGAMLRYNSTGTPATGLVSGSTYFVNTFVPNVNIPNLYNITIRAFPDSAANITPSGGSGTQTFLKIGVSIDKDIIHIRNSNFVQRDMVEYTFPDGARFTAETLEQTKTFYFVERAYDQHNYLLQEAIFVPPVATGGVLSTTTNRGRTYRTHAFTTVGTSSFVVTTAGDGLMDVLVVGGGGASSIQHAGGGGAGGMVYVENYSITTGTYSVVVGAGGVVTSNLNSDDNFFTAGQNGANSSFGGVLTALGGGGARPWANVQSNVGSNGGSGGAGWNANGGLGLQPSQSGLSGSRGFGNNAGNGSFSGGGGAGGIGGAGDNAVGGYGRFVPAFADFGVRGFFAGGGGGGRGGGGIPGGVGGPGGGGGLVPGGQTFPPAQGNGGANTGGGGGGAADNTTGGSGGSGVVLIRYPITPPIQLVAPVATGGFTSTATVDGISYRIHSFRDVGSSNFVVTNPGSWNEYEYLIVGGGASGGSYVGGGGGGGGVLQGRITSLSSQSYPIVVGAGGAGAGSTSVQQSVQGNNGLSSSAFGFTAFGGGGGGRYPEIAGSAGASGGGSGGFQNSTGFGGAGTTGQGFAGGNAIGGRPRGFTGGSGGGGAGSVGGPSTNAINTGGDGGAGTFSAITGTTLFWGGGGGGGNFADGARPGNGGIGGGGGGTSNTANVAGIGGGLALNTGGNGSPNGDPNNIGGSGGANTGGGGGGNGHHGLSGAGGSGIVIIRYPIAVV